MKLEIEKTKTKFFLLTALAAAAMWSTRITTHDTILWTVAYVSSASVAWLTLAWLKEPVDD